MALEVLDGVDVGREREVELEEPAEGLGEGGGHDLRVGGEPGEGVGEGLVGGGGGGGGGGGIVVVDEAVAGEEGTRGAEGHEVQRVLRVAEAEVLVVEAALEGVETATGVFRDGLQGRRGEVEVDGGVAEEVAQLAAHRGEEDVGAFFLGRWRLPHLRPQVGVADVQRDLAVPRGREDGRPIVSQFADAGVEKDEGPPEPAAHLGLEGVTATIG